MSDNEFERSLLRRERMATVAIAIMGSSFAAISFLYVYYTRSLVIWAAILFVAGIAYLWRVAAWTYRKATEEVALRKQITLDQQQLYNAEARFEASIARGRLLFYFASDPGRFEGNIVVTGIDRNGSEQSVSRRVVRNRRRGRSSYPVSVPFAFGLIKVDAILVRWQLICETPLAEPERVLIAISSQKQCGSPKHVRS